MKPIHIMIDGWPVVINHVQVKEVGQEFSVDIQWKINTTQKKAMMRYTRLSPEKQREADAAMEEGVTNFINAALEAAMEDVEQKYGALLNG